MASLAARLDRLEGQYRAGEDDPACQLAHARLTADIERLAGEVAQRQGTTAGAVIADAVARVRAEYATRTTEGGAPTDERP
jgi:hypothetical protein